MRLSFIAIFVFISLSLFAQEKLEISVNNPQPRVNERVYVQMFSFSNLMEDVIQAGFNNEDGKSEIIIYNSESYYT